MRKLYRRYTSLDRSRRHLIVEAATLLAVVSIGLRVWRFLTLRRILDRYVAIATGRRSSSLDAARGDSEAPEEPASTLTAATPHVSSPSTITASVETVDAIRWAIAAAARRIPTATCLVQALAADA